MYFRIARAFFISTLSPLLPPSPAPIRNEFLSNQTGRCRVALVLPGWPISKRRGVCITIVSLCVCVCQYVSVLCLCPLSMPCIIRVGNNRYLLQGCFKISRKEICSFYDYSRNIYLTDITSIISYNCWRLPLFPTHSKQNKILKSEFRLCRPPCRSTTTMMKTTMVVLLIVMNYVVVVNDDDDDDDDDDGDDDDDDYNDDDDDDDNK